MCIKNLFKVKNILTNLKRGFTIVELIVVIGIFTVIMSVALWNQKELSNNILITNLAYEIALAIREAQAYGIGVRAEIGAGNPNDFKGGFGIYVNMNNPEQLVLFNDKDDDKTYDLGAETFATYDFQKQNGSKIVAICAAHAPGAGHPCTSTADTAKTELSILFKRPNPEASFVVNTNPPIVKGPAYIVVNTLAGNNCRAIVVESTGQIHVENVFSPYPACVNQ